ncbi:MAG: class I SAM-dependent methyltransferase [Candidatus Omnitrophica bacterium]|nr:class I SAM-dependent methyltransferase [Candidatus Omnitrophota bacterium]
MSTCILCGSSNSTKSIFGGYRYNGSEFYLTRCSKCGFLYLDPIPDENVIESMYGDEFYFKNYWVRNSNVLGYAQGKEAARKNAEETLRVIKRYKSTGSLIDIGCAGGHFLSKAREMKYRCLGMELNKEMAEYAKNTYGINVINKPLHVATEDIGKFDVIYMGDTLEHLTDLDKVFKCVKKIMYDNAILAIDGPMDYNRSFYNAFRIFNMLFKKNRLSINRPYHLWEFDRKTIRMLLKRCGFKVLYLKIIEDPPRFVRGFDRDFLKEKLGRFIRNISKVISNNILTRGLELGNRVLLIASKV